MPTLNSWGNQVLTANVTLNGGTCDIGSDATSGAINIGTGAAARTVTVGNGTGASSVVLNCGTGALNLGSNAIARTTTLGNTTGASVLALKYGTGDFTLASATGTVMSALDTGEITYPLQSAFAAQTSALVANVTGNGATYSIICNTELFDQNSDYNNGTGIYTVPITGKYFFTGQLLMTGLTTPTYAAFLFVTTARNYEFQYSRPAGIGENINIGGTIIVSLNAGDTIKPTIYITGEAGNTDDMGFCGISGHLVC